MNDYENFGDVSIWHGQTWIRYGGDDWAECVETIGPGDLDNLADNQLRIERGSIYFSADNWDSAMSCCGVDRIGPPEYWQVAMAFKAYQGADSDAVEVVQFGAQPETAFMQRAWNVATADTVLHGNTKPGRYLEREWLQ